MVRRKRSLSGAGALLRASLSCLALGGALLPAACASGIPIVDPDHPRFAGLDAVAIARLRQGREEYVAKCSGCHPPHAPTAFPPRRWREELEKMASKAHLAPEELERVFAYLVALGAPGEGGTDR